MHRKKRFRQHCQKTGISISPGCCHGQQEPVNTLLDCAAHGINGIQERLYNRTDTSELDALEAALDFDLRKWWQPGAESYFGKLTIARLAKPMKKPDSVPAPERL